MTELKDIIKCLNETKLKNTAIYDLRDSSPFFDYFIITSASNKRELNSIINKIWEENLEYDHIEGTSESGWILLDMGTIILNVMSEEARELYSLDSIYMKYKKVEI